MKSFLSSLKSKVVLFVGALAMGCLMFSVKALAEGVEPLPVNDFLALLLQSVTSLKGAGGLAVVAVVVQVVMAFLRTSLADKLGVWKLLAVTGLSVVGSLVALMLQGVPFLTALLNGAVLSAIQVFVHQIVMQSKAAKA